MALWEADRSLYYRVSECGRSFFRGRCGCGRRALPKSCNSRLCLHCQKRRATVKVKQLAAFVEGRGRPRFITLTLQRHARGELAESIKLLRASLRRLRHRAAFRHLFRGGLSSIETKWQSKTRDRAAGWHTHVHVLAFSDDAGFVDQAALSIAWESCTRGAGRIVDIRGCFRSKEHDDQWCLRRKDGTLAPALKEAVKYITAGAIEKIGDGDGVEAWPTEAVREFVEATRHVRLYQTFGDFHGVQIPKAPPCSCEQCGQRVKLDESDGSFVPMGPREARDWILAGTPEGRRAALRVLLPYSFGGVRAPPEPGDDGYLF